MIKHVSFLLAIPLLAQNGGNLPDFSNLSLDELSAVKVTSVSKKEQKLSQVAAAVYVISQEEIHRSGMTNVADLLRIVPGITVSRLDSSKWAVTARGFNGRYAANLLVLIDGRSVYSPIFGGVYWDMSMPLLDDIDRIEVIRGPGASVWGANAVNGVINIITRTAGEMKGKSFTAGAGTTDRAFGQIRFGGNLSDSVSYRSFFSASDHSALQTATGQSGQDGWSDEQAGVRVDGTTHKGGWQLEADLYQNHRSEVGYFPSIQNGFTMATNQAEYTGNSADLAFEWRRRLTENSDLRVNSYGDFISRPEPGISTAETRIGDFEIQYHLKAGKAHDFSFGLADRLIFEAGPTSGFIQANPAQLTYQVGSGFAQDEIHLARDRVLLTLGVKLEHDLFAGWQPQPTFRALWTPSKNESLWVSASRASRSPDFYERYMSAEIFSYNSATSPYGIPAVAVISGSTDFQPEQLTAYEVGFRTQLSPKLSFDIAAFYDVHQKLETENLGMASLIFAQQAYLFVPVYFTNNLNATAAGGEIAATFHPYARWKLAGSYSYLNVDPRLIGSAPPGSVLPGTIDTSPNSSPRNNFKAQSFLNLSRTLQFDTLLFSSSGLISPIYPSSDYLVPPHTRLDVRVGWRITPKIEVSLSGQDLLDARHIEILPEAMTIRRYVPRGYYLKTIWHF